MYINHCQVDSWSAGLIYVGLFVVYPAQSNMAIITVIKPQKTYQEESLEDRSTASQIISTSLLNAGKHREMGKNMK